MTVQDNWLANLRALVDELSEGDDKRVGYRAVASASGLSEEYIYQLYEGKPKADGSPRHVGPRAAKAIARAFAEGRPHDWFDQAASTVATRTDTARPEPTPATRPVLNEEAAELTYAGRPSVSKRVRVVGMAKLGDNGWYEELSLVPGMGDGYVDVPTRDPDAYALLVRGDSMHPAIRDGWLVVVEPNSRPAVGEYVAIKLRDGKKMVKELLYYRKDSVALLSVNGERRITLGTDEIELIHAVGFILPPSKWRPDIE
ncbi:S24 family peptidase [Caldimonas tepidiphila]|uniref:S24 family peptidase n=1 Tax=Caldimonas tepidiphila TaxID=2315841 RepID=UPI001300623E|nr:S24 family peptidase [Caldimonas tepidiphila]